MAAVFRLVLVVIFGAMFGRPILILVPGMIITSVAVAVFAFAVTVLGLPVPPSFVQYASLFVSFITAVSAKAKIQE